MYGYIGTPSTAPSDANGFAEYTVLELNGHDAVISGHTPPGTSTNPSALLVNNGYVLDSTSGGYGPGKVIIDGHSSTTYGGAKAKGAGYYQNTVLTINHGLFQA